MRETPKMSEKKERNRQRLADRYYGKRDILASWEERDLKSAPKIGDPEEVERDYIYNLRRRVRGYSLDLCYRGDDDFTEAAK
jgi:hypothetical protein